VLSRETAVLLPAAAIAAGLVVAAERRFQLRHAGLYLACCAPAAVLVALLVKGKIGTAYEPDFEVVSAQIAGAGAAPGSTGVLGSPWLESAVTQAGLFFRYLASWIWPDTGAMAIDVRVAFAGSWPLPLAVLAVVAFLGYGLLGLHLLRRGRSPAWPDSACCSRGYCFSSNSLRFVTRSRLSSTAAICGRRA